MEIREPQPIGMFKKQNLAWKDIGSSVYMHIDPWASGRYTGQGDTDGRGGPRRRNYEHICLGTTTEAGDGRVGPYNMRAIAVWPLHENEEELLKVTADLLALWRELRIPFKPEDPSDLDLLELHVAKAHATTATSSLAWRLRELEYNGNGSAIGSPSFLVVLPTIWSPEKGLEEHKGRLLAAIERRKWFGVPTNQHEEELKVLDVFTPAAFILRETEERCRKTLRRIFPNLKKS